MIKVICFIDYPTHKSGIPVPVHIAESCVKSDKAPYLVEASVSLMVVTNHVSMGVVARACNNHSEKLCT
jgi:hypothetical protein